MNAYIDSSVLLRIVLGEAGRLRTWGRIATAVSSELLRVECLRVIDRARIAFRLPEEEVVERRAAVLESLSGVTLVPLDSAVMDRAGAPYPTLLGTLDAIHLASALLARTRIPDLVLATHDEALAAAGRAMGFNVQGA